MGNPRGGRDEEREGGRSHRRPKPFNMSTFSREQNQPIETAQSIDQGVVHVCEWRDNPHAGALSARHRFPRPGERQGRDRDRWRGRIDVEENKKRGGIEEGG